MRSFIKEKVVFGIFTLFSSFGYAQNQYPYMEYITLEGLESLTIPGNQMIENTLQSNSYKFMKIRPTQKMLDKVKKADASLLQSGGELDYSSGIYPFNKTGAVDLGMANVPVLDQGQYGTCVTFSATASLDARFKLGDYIDQQCSLALDASLGNNYWQGAGTANQIINPLKKYGVMLKNQCFGYTYAQPLQYVNLNYYYYYSDKSISNNISTVNTPADLNSLKTALKAGYRVTIGFAYVRDFPTLIMGTDGPSSMNTGGLWACQQPSSQSNRCQFSTSGHEVIVIGFDDTQQLLKIRNSWSAQNGDQGNYYMTYSYFNAMVFDQTVIQ